MSCVLDESPVAAEKEGGEGLDESRSAQLLPTPKPDSSVSLPYSFPARLSLVSLALNTTTSSISQLLVSVQVPAKKPTHTVLRPPPPLLSPNVHPRPAPGVRPVGLQARLALNRRPLRRSVQSRLSSSLPPLTFAPPVLTTHLHPPALSVPGYAGDLNGLSIARSKLRAAYEEKRTTTDVKLYSEDVQHAKEVGDLLLRNVVQGKEKEPGHYGSFSPPPLFLLPPL